MTLAIARPPTDHPEECTCVPCLLADMDCHVYSTFGIDSQRYADGRNGENVAPERTRYATPGARSGYGIVREISRGQLNRIRWMMATRDTSKLVRLPGSEVIERMSLRGASDLIDRLEACPVLPGMPERPPGPWEREATAPMLAYLHKLYAGKQHTFAPLPGYVPFALARHLIDQLTDKPWKPCEATSRPTRTGAPASLAKPIDVGAYLLDGTVYKVQRGRESGKLYAKVLVKVDPYTKMVRGKEKLITAEFKYSGAAIVSRLTPDMRMTLEMAKEYGAQFGVCCECGAVLTAEASIEAQIGPVCAGKLGR